MKKNSLLILSLLLLSSCGTTSTSSVSTKPSTTVSTSEVSNKPTSSTSTIDTKQAISDTLNVIKSLKQVSETREFFSIYKDDVKIYEKYTIKEYNDTDGIERNYCSINGISSLENSEDYVKSVQTIYYDGDNSYTSDSDGMYKKEACKKELAIYSVNYDFDKLEELTYTKMGYENKLSGVVKKANITSFLGKSLNNVEEVKVDTYSSNGDFTQLNLAYVQNGYDVAVQVKFVTSKKSFGLPASTLIK